MLAEKGVGVVGCGMNSIRLLGEGRSFYHCISRVVDRRMVFEAKHKEVFRKVMRNLEAFMGVRVVTYCFLSNHFHLLIEVPDELELKPLSEDELLALLPRLHDATTVRSVKQALERAQETDDIEGREAIMARFEKRRGSLSFFMKELKQRATLYMNKELDRKGTLWESRFKSVLVEGGETALLAVAAYIDLNPVRAGIVKHPEDYRWSGYAESLSGTRGAKLARRGLGIILADCLSDPDLKTDWRRTGNRYRQFLFEEGVEREANNYTGEGASRGISEKSVENAIEVQGEMTLSEVVRHKVRYFCDGAILGSAGFVDEVFLREQSEGRMSQKRKSGARKLRGAQWGDLRVLRDLRRDVIKPPESKSF